MNKEKQIEIEVITYEQERLNYFTDLMNKANNKFNRLFKKYKDAPYLSEEFQRLSDAGRGAEFYKDVVKMLEKSYRKQSEGEWKRQKGTPEAICPNCGREVVYQIVEGRWEFEYYCPHCGSKMKGGAE